MTIDDALSIVTKPTPVQEWLASLKMPLQDIPDICDLCGTPNCDDPHACPDCGMDGRYPCRCIDELPGDCDLVERDEITEAKRYEDAEGER